PTAIQKERYQNLELFQKVLHFVEDHYVDGVKNTDLVYGAIKGMLATLDPHSNFLPPEVFKDMKIDTSGQFGGLGIEIGMRDNVLTIVAPIEDTPAWKAGLMPGDRIVKINGDSTKGMNLVEAVAKMRGKKGSDVLITVYRKGFDVPKEFRVTRAVIKLQSVKLAELDKGYGYIRLTNFNETAGKDVRAAIENLEKKSKLRGLVFDLRTNPGGLLDQAVDVSSLFIDDGVVVSTIGRNRDQKEVKHAARGKARKDFSLAILVNSSTASAAEIVAGALQDHRRAVVMGERTFGKGSVQQVIELGETMGLKLTIARFYTPNGTSIQEKGVTPDILLDQYNPKLLAKARVKSDSMRERDLPGHIQPSDAEPEKGEYSKDEMDAMVGTGKKPASSAKAEDDDESVAALKQDPREDYQVREALNYLRSHELFNKFDTKKEASAAPIIRQDPRLHSDAAITLAL
ncbi:MAG: S41 family peptidase, partial [Bacteriovoracia bacterium]